MFNLKNKNILLISPQPWDGIQVSKHHYATELAMQNNYVYFLHPLTTNHKTENITSLSTSTVKGITLVSQNIKLPSALRFRFFKLYKILMRYYTKKLLNDIKVPIDIVWSFDLGANYPLDLFPVNCLKIFHPVDEPRNKFKYESAKGTDFLFTVTPEILNLYNYFHGEKYLIPHGLANQFKTQEIREYNAPSRIQVGYSGNLLREDIDRQTLLKIINSNKNIDFNFWGNYTSPINSHNPIENHETNIFINTLKSCINVKLYGIVTTSELAFAYKSIDAFLICYDIQKDQSGGSNYHKILEYLSTGKAIISNNVTSYKDRPDLIIMDESRSSNSGLEELFKNTIYKIVQHNSIENQTIRINYALNNLYSNHLTTIDRIISNFKK